MTQNLIFYIYSFYYQSQKKLYNKFVATMLCNEQIFISQTILDKNITL